MQQTFTSDLLRVQIFQTRAEMGAKAAADAAKTICTILAQKEECNIIFAAAPSQNEMLAGLLTHTEIDWTRINAFHMDEYIGLPQTAPQRFGNFLKAALFDRAPFKSVHYIHSDALDHAAECARYGSLLAQYPADVVCMGIGENGHIAFNDPHVAFFNDPQRVKIVALDQKCRQQQVNDGCFAALEDVPHDALTLTIPTLTAAPHLFCVVPAATKAQAVKDTVHGEISERCPASILRRHADATLYLDQDSAKEL